MESTKTDLRRDQLKTLVKLHLENKGYSEQSLLGAVEKAIEELEAEGKFSQQETQAAQQKRSMKTLKAFGVTSLLLVAVNVSVLYETGSLSDMLPYTLGMMVGLFGVHVYRTVRNSL